MVSKKYQHSDQKQLIINKKAGVTSNTGQSVGHKSQRRPGPACCPSQHAPSH